MFLGDQISATVNWALHGVGVSSRENRTSFDTVASHFEGSLTLETSRPPLVLAPSMLRRSFRPTPSTEWLVEGNLKYQGTSGNRAATYSVMNYDGVAFFSLQDINMVVATQHESTLTFSDGTAISVHSNSPLQDGRVAITGNLFVASSNRSFFLANSSVLAHSES